MKNLDNISIDSLDIYNHSAWGTRRIQRALVDNYKAKMEVAQVDPLSDKITQHLTNYIKISSIPSISSEQEIALAIHYLPEDTTNPNLSKDDLIVHMLKSTIGNCEYSLRDIKQMQHKVLANKAKLNFTGDWLTSSMDISDAVRRANLAKAYEIFAQIKNMSKHNPPISSHDLPYIYSLQIAYYIDIMLFLLDHIGRNPMIDLYVAVEAEYQGCVEKLRQLPELSKPEREYRSPCNLVFSRFRALSQLNQHNPKRSARVYPS